MALVTVPDTADGLAEAIDDAKKRQEIMATPATFRGFLDAYAKEANKHDPDLGKQLSAAMKAGMADFAKEQEARDGARVTRLPMAEGLGGAGSRSGNETVTVDGVQRQVLVRGPRSEGAKLNAKWGTLGEYLTAIHPRIIQEQGLPDVLKNLSEGLGSEGGSLVPDEFRAELLRLALESAVVRPRARVLPMTSASIRLPAIRDASHASTVFGGATGTWVGEAASLSSTTNQPTFTQILLTARKLTGYTVAANELLADSAISLEALINSLFADALAYFEDDAFINGTGAGQPLGILNADALVSVAKETGQAATTIVYENLLKMFSRMLPQSIGRAVWVMHPDTLPQLGKLSLAVGTGGSAVWLANSAVGPPATILGRPVVFSEKCRTLGTAGDVYFVDLSYYLIGDRQALSVVASPWTNFTTDETVWRFVQRVDGRPWLQVALTPRFGSNTMSPYVSLATRA